MHNIFDTIDNLQENGVCHYIDILPMKVSGNDYFALEEYLLENCLHDFASRISDIMIKLIHYYPAQIYLTEFGVETDAKYATLIGKDLRSMPLSELAKIISYIVLHDISSVQIVLGNAPYTLVSINGHFSVDIYNASVECLNLMGMLAQQEGLFIKLAE